jgi:hypothetical protein
LKAEIKAEENTVKEQAQIQIKEYESEIRELRSRFKKELREIKSNFERELRDM